MVAIIVPGRFGPMIAGGTPAGGGGWAGPTTNLAHRWPLNSLTIADQVGAINGTAGAGCSLATGPSGAGNTSVAFDGSSDAITLASDPTSGQPLTLAFWLYITNYAGNNGDPRFICFGATTSWVVTCNSSGIFGVNGFAINQENAAIGLSTWHHYILSYNGTTLTIYKDNSASTLTGGDPGNAGDGGVYGIGERNTGARLWPGRMSQVCVYTKVLDGTERTTLFNAF